MDRRPLINTRPPHCASGKAPQRFGPHVPALARFLAEAGATADSVALLVEVNQRWPNLSFRDFMGAAVLAEAFALKTAGTA
jgi:hypothetical protein